VALTPADLANGLPPGAVDEAGLQALLEDDSGTPFYVTTLLRYDEAAAGDDITVAQIETVLPEDAEVVFTAAVERQMQGEPLWERVEVVRYPDASSYAGSLVSDDALVLADQRAAVVAESQVVVATPVTPIVEEVLVAGEEPPFLPRAADPPCPSSEADQPFMLIAAVSIADDAEFEDGRESDLSGEEALDEHYLAASQPGGGGDLGIRPVRWMDVQLTLVGDAEAVESIRFNYWPSRATLFNVASTAGGIDGASTENRTAGLDNAWTMMAVPEIDLFTPEPPLIDPALLTPAAVAYLEAAAGFQQCIEDAGFAWIGEPTGAGGANDDGEYVTTLLECQAETEVARLLAEYFAEPDDSPGGQAIDEELLNEAAVAFAESVDRFGTCLDDAGFGWLGDPRGADPATPAGDPAYLEAFGTCTVESGMGLGLSVLLSD
jgi:hypothetical protein